MESALEKGTGGKTTVKLDPNARNTRSNTPQTQLARVKPSERCDIGECLPQGETVEECKARLRRIVTKQKQCYDVFRTCPEWLDSDFLYRINYGPGTQDDATKAWKNILQPVVSRRQRRLRVTLLDRRIVDMLFKAMYKKGAKPPILHSDWNETTESVEGLKYPSQELASPFDYVSHTSETALYRWLEEFVVQNLWRRDYSSALFGNEKRPPMAAVALDMIHLVKYMATLPRYPERSLAECFTEFLSCQRHKLHSLNVEPDFDFDWACRGYMWDLFNIIILESLSENGLDKYNPKRAENVPDEAEFVNVTWVEHAKFPGGDTIGIECPVDRNHLNELYGSLEEMRASYICSGPFKIALTPNLSDHLTIRERKLLMYCDKPSKTRKDRGHIPGAGYYGPYVRHTLGRLLGVDTLLTELTYSYSIIFSRDSQSRAIGKALFGAPEYQLNPVFCDSHDMTTIGRAGQVIILNWTSSFKEGRDPMLSLFQQYRGHFALIQQQMTNWKPEKRADLLQPGYGDRFIWYTSIFGLVIGMLGIISIITSIISAVTGIVSMNAALAALKQ